MTSTINWKHAIKKEASGSNDEDLAYYKMYQMAMFLLKKIYLTKEVLHF
jgi:hypothetical protein